MSNNNSEDTSFTSVFQVSNVLTKNNFKPYWETVRDYFYIVMISVAVYMAFSVQPGQHFHCRPAQNFRNNLTTADTAFVNAVCFGQFAKVQPINAYAGPLALVTSLLIYVVIMLWLSASCVIDVFSKVRDMDEKVRRDSSIKLEVLEELIAKAVLKSPNAEEDGQTKTLLQVKRMCADLWALRRQSDALALYIVRNLFSLLLVVISAFIPIFIWIHQNCFFECNIQIGIYHNMTCIHMIADQTQPSLIIFCLSIALQAVLTLCSLLHLTYPTRIVDDGQLVLHFSQYSRAVDPVTRFLLTKSLSDVTTEVEAATGGDDRIGSRRPFIAIGGHHLIGSRRPSIATEGTPLIPTVPAEDDPLLKELRKSNLNALGANDFSASVRYHENFFHKSTLHIIERGCGCDGFNFNLRDLDRRGKNLLHYALRRRRWASEPNYKIIYHFLSFSTDKYALSDEKLVYDGYELFKVDRFLNKQSDSMDMKSLTDAVKLCKDAGDFSKYVRMTEGRFTFTKS